MHMLPPQAGLHAGRSLLTLAAIVSATSTATVSGAVSPPAEVQVSVAPAELTYGGAATVSGRVLVAGAGLAGGPLALQAAPYPYRAWQTIARGISAPDGSFAFAPLHPDRDTRLRVVLEGAPAAASRPLPVIVDAHAALAVSAPVLGRTHLSLRIVHSRWGGSGSVPAWWFAQVPGRRVFRLLAVTSTRELGPGVTYASATVAPPGRRFAVRVCLNPPWEHAMGAPFRHSGCPEHDFRARGPATRSGEYAARGRGIPLAPYPSPGAIAAAAGFLGARAGRTSFAVIDSHGRLQGVRVHEHFHSASVVKVMMLTAYLQMLQARHRPLSAFDSSLLYPMIHISDNSAASRVLAILGGGALWRVARETGMSDYAPAVGWWAFTQTSAADQAKLFFSLERVIPGRFYGYARSLLSGIDRSQSWGIPSVARPRWSVFFKTGWLPSEGLFNEAARLERPGVMFSVAVLTSGEPSIDYGAGTIAGIGSALLARAPRAASSAVG
jgi:hypothetical protein